MDCSWAAVLFVEPAQGGPCSCSAALAWRFRHLEDFQVFPALLLLARHDSCPFHLNTQLPPTFRNTFFRQWGKIRINFTSHIVNGPRKTPSQLVTEQEPGHEPNDQRARTFEDFLSIFALPVYSLSRTLFALLKALYSMSKLSEHGLRRTKPIQSMGIRSTPRT